MLLLPSPSSWSWRCFSCFFPDGYFYYYYFTTLSNMRLPQQDADVKPTVNNCCVNVAENLHRTVERHWPLTLFQLSWTLFLMLIREVIKISVFCVPNHTNDVSLCQPSFLIISNGHGHFSLRLRSKSCSYIWATVKLVMELLAAGPFTSGVPSATLGLPLVAGLITQQKIKIHENLHIGLIFIIRLF